MLQSCIAYPASNPGADIVHNPFAIEVCVLAATCSAFISFNMAHLLKRNVMPVALDGFAKAVRLCHFTTPTNRRNMGGLDMAILKEIKTHYKLPPERRPRLQMDYERCRLLGWKPDTQCSFAT